MVVALRVMTSSRRGVCSARVVKRFSRLPSFQIEGDDADVFDDEFFLEFFCFFFAR